MEGGFFQLGTLAWVRPPRFGKDKTQLVRRFFLHFMDNLSIVPLVGAVALGWVYGKRPLGYSQVGEDPLLSSNSKLLYASYFFSVLLTGASFVSALYGKLIFYTLPATWFILFLLAPRLHAYYNVYEGSQFSLFFISLLTVLAQILLNRSILPLLMQWTIHWNVASILFFVQVGLGLLYLTVVGMWSERLDEDDDNDVVVV